MMAAFHSYCICAHGCTSVLSRKTRVRLELRPDLWPGQNALVVNHCLPDYGSMNHLDRPRHPAVLIANQEPRELDLPGGHRHGVGPHVRLSACHPVRQTAFFLPGHQKLMRADGIAGSPRSNHSQQDLVGQRQPRLWRIRDLRPQGWERATKQQEYQADPDVPRLLLPRRATACCGPTDDANSHAVGYRQPRLPL